MLIAEPDPAVRRRVVAAIGSGESIEIAGEAADGPEALRLHTELAPDVVLLSVELPNCDVSAVTRRIGAAGSWVIVLSSGDDPLVAECVRAGARGVLRKDRSGISTAAIVLRLLAMQVPREDKL